MWFCGFSKRGWAGGIWPSISCCGGMATDGIWPGGRPGGRITPGVAFREAGPECGARCGAPESSVAGPRQALEGPSPPGWTSCPAQPSGQPERVSWLLGFVSLTVSLQEGDLYLGNDIWVSLGLLDAHGLAIERETPRGVQDTGGAADLEEDKGLTSHPGSMTPGDVQDLAKLGEDSVRGLLQLIFLHLLFEAVDINRVIRASLGNCHGVRCWSKATEPQLPQGAPATFLSVYPWSSLEMYSLIWISQNEK